MTEQEFITTWEKEKPIYDAWGAYIVDKISSELTKKGINLSTFLKIPAKHRLKDDASLIEKAFYRPEKKYADPYNDIEDKVGARFVVLTISEINTITEIIESINDWSHDKCKDFDKDKEKSPLLFTYQSIHYILRPASNIKYNDIEVPSTTPCEVQIRTLLQHAHSELTHDAIYKSVRIIKPEIHRTVAKSMALIETTDDFFSQVTEQLKDPKILQELDELYISITGTSPVPNKFGAAIIDEYSSIISEKTIEDIKTFSEEKKQTIKFLVERKKENKQIYKHGIFLFIYWMLKKHKTTLVNNWPLPIDVLSSLATDFGVSIDPHD